MKTKIIIPLALLALAPWNFKGDNATPHVGPMAQDFHAAFGLGTDDKHIFGVGPVPDRAAFLNKTFFRMSRSVRQQNIL